ncbi:hypothetical protein J3T78_04600 [Staphylococcus nepalensis]|uniref:Phage protein n=1 Tax=Staphylococcus nepalensis TaxID=214473 RepID=A0ABS3L072_9STAP|nr:hypothetical protein [Staphylococcus nepalensis]MBO1213793.1 hypothetical protein [Staphylococcus nepalensis]MBO1214986.1 hypothetical protein [Staphylococcus nepalensis]MBO1226942.1 hypothetical protein [Staphylococcus nepalensis]MBO1234056.1 hypothetical protein [Staphylococcus nepalensis]MBO1236989.1 hypothetical protein [Staphylococcus nepalensis]
MAYEYEDKLRNYLIGHKNVNPKFDGFEILQSVDELQEVYRKAKAFDEIENILNNYFENYGCYPSPKEYVQEVVSVIDNYKERVDDER